MSRQQSSATFFCGLQQQDLAGIEDRGSTTRHILQVGQRQGNIALSVRPGKGAPLPLSAAARDLVEIGAYLHQSDRLVIRDIGTWSRDLEYHVAVSELERWRELAPLLGRVTSFLSGDRIRFHFHPRRGEPTWSAEIPRPREEAGAVMLYSGGLDSSSGLGHLLARGARAIAVTQYSNRLEDRSSLLEDISRLGSGSIPLVAFRVVPRRTRVHSPAGAPPPSPLEDLEATWRLRSFLYLSLAAAVADALGIGRVLMFENGVLAHNLPFDPYVIGARSTRHAHPGFLLLMERLFGGLFARPMTIRNPFQFLTKGSEAEPLGALTREASGDPSLIARTNSCWYFPNLVARLSHSSGRQMTHCGACMPCKIRRLAVLEAGLERWEPVSGQYFVDPLRGATPSDATSLSKFAYEQHGRNLARLQSYVRRIGRCRDLRQFAAEWPQVFEFEGKNLSSQPVDSVGASLFGMYRSFADHAVGIL